MPSSLERFEKTTDTIAVDAELGIVYGWGAVFTENGEEYFDTQGDAIDGDAMEAAFLDFMENTDRVAGDLHEEACGTVPFGLPITEEVRKAFGIESDVTGLAMAMRPSDEVLEKFKSGEYTGFSIGGTRQAEEVVEKFAKASDRRNGRKFQAGKRRRMTKFQLDEISAVDSPAQVGARALLIKRKGTPEYERTKRGRADVEASIEKRAMLTGTTAGHSHLLILDHEGEGGSARAFGETDSASGTDFHRHPWVMDADGNIVIGAVNGHTHDAGELSTTRSIAIERLLEKRGDPMADPKKTTTSDDNVADLTKRLERAEKVATLSDSQRAHFQGLKDDAADAFLEKSAKERDEEVEAAVRKADDEKEVVYTDRDGAKYTKRDDPRMVANARRADEALERAEKAERNSNSANFVKRAQTELDALPGTPEEKAEILKALDAIEGDEAKAAALKAVVAGNKAMKAAFGRVGSSTAFAHLDETSAHGRIAKRAAEIRKADASVTEEAAWIQAEDEMPDVAEEALQADRDAAPSGNAPE